MHNFIRIAVLAVVFAGATVQAGAATPDEFYTSLLRRGIAAHDAGRYDDAARQLRIAAFGLVESVEHYQTAQIYLALTYDKVKENDRAREAARRVVAAQRVDAKFAGLSIPAGVRNGFEGVASQLLGPGDLAALHATTTAPRMNPPAQSSAPPSATPTRTTTQQPAIQQPASTQPQTTTASDSPAPQTTAPATQSPRPTQQQPASTPTPVRTTPATSTPAPSTSAPVTTAPATKPPQTSPSTTPATTKPAQTTTTTTTKPATSAPTSTPAPATTKPAMPPPAAAPRPLTASEITSRIGAAERALGSANLNEARRLYREVLAVSTLEHETLVRVAEGLYRSRDFANSLNAFSRAGTLRKGEEPYRYYIAVALYETGDYARAKKELAAALPYIEVTPDVARYRTKIEGAM